MRQTITMTKEEQQEIEKEIRSKAKKKNIRTEFTTIRIDHLFTGTTVSGVINKLQETRTEILKKYPRFSENDIKVGESYSGYGHPIVFYAIKKENDEQFERRIKEMTSKKISALTRAKKEMIDKEKRAKQKDKETLIKIMTNLGPEIYNVFEELKAKTPQE